MRTILGRLVVIVALGAPCAAGAQARMAPADWPIEAPYRTHFAQVLEDTLPDSLHILRFHEEVARALELPALRHVTLPPGVRELRMTVGGDGLWAPRALLRLLDFSAATGASDSVVGELWLTWGRIRREHGREVLLPNQDSATRRLRGCTPLAQTPKRYVCRLEAAADGRPLAWPAIRDTLERHHVWTLPDSRGLPRAARVGYTSEPFITVEILDGDRHRVYRYGDFGNIDHPTLTDAEAIYTLVRRLEHAVPPTRPWLGLGRRPRRELPPRTQPTGAESPAEPALRARADSVIAQLVAGINRRDPALVAALTLFPGEQPHVAAAREAIEDFRHHFRGEPVSRYAFVREPGGGPRPPALHFEYELVTKGGVRKTVVAYYESRTNHFRVYDEFLSYSARVRSLVRGVVEALRARDAARLARLFNPDDIDYPVALAERVIANYERRFDLGTLRYRFDGLAPERRGDGGHRLPRWFRYTIYGTKGASRVEHRVEIIHGDGLVGWRDPLVPPPSG